MPVPSEWDGDLKGVTGEGANASPRLVWISREVDLSGADREQSERIDRACGKCVALPYGWRL